MAGFLEIGGGYLIWLWLRHDFSCEADFLSRGIHREPLTCRFENLVIGLIRCLAAQFRVSERCHKLLQRVRRVEISLQADWHQAAAREHAAYELQSHESPNHASDDLVARSRGANFRLVSRVPDHLPQVELGALDFLRALKACAFHESVRARARSACLSTEKATAVPLLSVPQECASWQPRACMVALHRTNI